MDNHKSSIQVGSPDSEQLSKLDRDPRPIGIEHAYHVLKQDIIKCVLPPGSRVSESKLSERYGIGRASIRTALTRLSQDGLVRVAPREGYFIEDITLKEARDVFETRMLLEPPTARLAAERITKASLEHLQELIERSFDNAHPHEQVNQRLSRNKEIHVAIAAASGNTYIPLIIAQMFDRSHRMLQLLHLANHFGRPVYDFKESSHEAIIEALREGKGEAVEQMMKEHLQVARRDLMDALTIHPSLMNVNLQAPDEIE